MILRELYELYGRLAAAGENVPQAGRSRLPVSFRIVLTPEGGLVRIEDARSEERFEKKSKKGAVSVTSKLVPTHCMLLGVAKPSGAGLNPCFLWDNAPYLLGYVDEKQQDKAGRIRQAFERLRERHLELESVVPSGAYVAVCRFLSTWNPDALPEHVADTAILSHNGVFRIQGECHDIHEDPDICRWWELTGKALWWGDSHPDSGRCLITNEDAPIANLHEPIIKGVLGAQASGAKLVSFNCKAFESYGREQSVNAPVSEAAAFAYCNALNYLLASEHNRVRLGESTVVFWTDAPKQQAGAIEMFTRMSLNPEPPQAQDAALLHTLWDSLRSLAQGKCPANKLELPQASRFFILGLSPNAARLSVRFYRESTFGDFLQHLQTHYEGMMLQKRGDAFHDPDVISPFMILRESVRDINKELPPATIGHLMNAILGGTPYPEMLAMSILRRFKADGDINHIRCAFLKAWLNRNHHLNITTMLDTNNTQPGYLLGRLFAILVKTQEDALGRNLNRTLRDGYYASASATPLVVFPRLIRLFQHHISKLDAGLKTVRDKQMQAVMWALGNNFPVHLSLAAQGSFALGYYHQMQSFYTVNTSDAAAETSQNQ